METQGDSLEIITVGDKGKSVIESSSPVQVQETTNKPALFYIQKRLVEFEERMKMKGDMKLSQANRSHSPSGSVHPVCIYRVPRRFETPAGLSDYFEPRSVCIGPYRRPQESSKFYSKLIEFEDSIKPELLNSLVNQTSEGKEEVLERLARAMEELETRVSDCYSLLNGMSSDYPVGMMVFDGCFVVELLRQVCIDESGENLRHSSLISEDNRLIASLMRDLLLMENQLPFFVLEKIFDICIKKGGKSDPLRLVALKLFSRFLPISDPESESLKRAVLDPDFKAKHLLHLFHYSHTGTFSPTQHGYHPSSIRSTQCATRLRSAGISLRPRKRTHSFLQIKFRNGVLEIPPINYDEFIAILLNCVAWEQAHPDIRRYFNAYVDFMSYLIISENDVTFLREEGIIDTIGYTDREIVHKFKAFRHNVSYVDTDCYLSELVNEMEAYCRSNLATLRRKYFSSPLTFISIVAATLVLLFTGLQTIMAILSYVKPHS